MPRYLKAIVIIISVLSVTVPASASRFWVAVGKRVPKDFIIDQLVKKPNSLKLLGDDYAEGWAVGYYDADEPLVFRGPSSAFTDDYYDRAVYDVADLEPSIVIAHIRRSSSGCHVGVNPQPFEIISLNKTWLFGHNGEIDKNILIDLIGKEYLAKHEPKACSNHPPDSWIDSELYFIYLMKLIEKSAGSNVEEALKLGLTELRSKLKVEERALNFFLTDGLKLWAYREGNTLFYHFDQKQKVTAVSSSVPDYRDNDWKNFPEAVIGILEPSKEAQFMLLTQSSEVSPEPQLAGESTLP